MATKRSSSGFTPGQERHHYRSVPRKKILPVGDVMRIRSNAPESSPVPSASKQVWPMNACTKHVTVKLPSIRAKSSDLASYIEQLISENQRLKRQATSQASCEENDSPPSVQENIGEIDQSSRNPLIGDRAWFHPYDAAALPIYIGEAACTAFATRFRRFLTGNNAAAHIPRTQYVHEAVLSEAGKAEAPWPPLPQAQLLVKVAFSQVSRIYHMILRKSTMATLKEIYKTSRFDCPVNTCKFFALFAFGEVYSIRSSSSTGQNIPGMAYYARALNLIQILPERPTITHIESLLLLSLFSYYLNRRHFAIILVGNALRVGLTIGLNHNIPESQLIDPVERQHRVRIWWTIYLFDRMWGSKMGIPMSILDEDIHVDMPSDTSPQQEHDEQFSNTEYVVASIKLARIAGETITKIYSRKKYAESFLQRVQHLLKSLKTWVETLPEHIKLNSEDVGLTPKYIVSLHLSFNQCVILATRPTLLHVLTELKKHDNEISGDDDRDVVSQAALTLAEACIHAAQHSHLLIIERWVSGSLPIFGYFSAQYLFSSALVLAMSSLISSENATRDTEAFETAVQVLQCMSGNGNFAAAEFFQNLKEVKQCLSAYRDGKGRPRGSGSDSLTSVTSARNDFIAGSAPVSQTMENTNFPIALGSGMNLSMRNGSGGFTTEMAFVEPTMQAFLEQSDLDLGVLNPADLSTGDASSLYFWSTPQWTG